MSEDLLDVEKFYVYRSLHNDESWGAIIMVGEMPHGLPNIDFGMRIFARNEKEAIAKGKLNYDKIHTYDSDKENIRRFAASALKTFTERGEDSELAAKNAIKYAVQLNKEYNEYFRSLEKGNDNE